MAVNDFMCAHDSFLYNFCMKDTQGAAYLGHAACCLWLCKVKSKDLVGKWKWLWAQWNLKPWDVFFCCNFFQPPNLSQTLSEPEAIHIHDANPPKWVKVKARLYKFYSHFRLWKRYDSTRILRIEEKIRSQILEAKDYFQKRCFYLKSYWII